mmetsp:Transcript_58164/g.85081  ORF Transcript_58164/g.85081 Transcript_58164/m.85081 type:complete len:263 (+) Transcript_58164:456-1244(+)
MQCVLVRCPQMPKRKKKKAALTNERPPQTLLRLSVRRRTVGCRADPLSRAPRSREMRTRSANRPVFPVVAGPAITSGCSANRSVWKATWKEQPAARARPAPRSTSSSCSVARPSCRTRPTYLSTQPFAAASTTRAASPASNSTSDPATSSGFSWWLAGTNASAWTWCFSISTPISRARITSFRAASRPVRSSSGSRSAYPFWIACAQAWLKGTGSPSRGETSAITCVMVAEMAPSIILIVSPEPCRFCSVPMMGSEQPTATS